MLTVWVKVTPCQTDPDRWSDPEPGDMAAKQICWECPVRRLCAAEALQAQHHAQGLWAGVVIPGLASGGSYAAKKRHREHAFTRLADIAHGVLEQVS